MPDNCELYVKRLGAYQTKEGETYDIAILTISEYVETGASYDYKLHHPRIPKNISILIGTDKFSPFDTDYDVQIGKKVVEDISQRWQQSQEALNNAK
jgi:hypothetical protein